MFFELQLSASVFSRIVRNRLKAVPLCIDREVPAEDGTPLVIDRIEIGNSTWVQREQTIDIVNGLPQPRDIATQVVWIFSPTNYTSHTVPFPQVEQEVQTIVGSAWFEGTALGGDLLARHVPEAGVVRIYAALARAVR